VRRITERLEIYPGTKIVARMEHDGLLHESYHTTLDPYGYGFADERDYWTQSSSARYLSRIRRPCLLINAVNDPFIPSASLPDDAILRSPWLESLFPRQGGHAGFLEGPLGRRSWSERRALAFLQRLLADGKPSEAVALRAAPPISRS